MTIEEAWEDVTEAALCLHHGDRCHPFKEAWAALEVSTRVLALAVLEEAEAFGGYDSLTTVGVGLRARIEALG